MTVTSDTAARAEPAAPTRLTDKPDEDPSPSTASVSVATEATAPSLFSRIIGLFRQRSDSTLREELAEALAEADSDSEAFSANERAMLNNILSLREVSVEDVMVPRADIEAVGIGTKVGELMAIFEKSGHSRMPVYSGSLDDPRGMVHIRDLLAHLTRCSVAEPGEPGAARLDLGKVDLDRTIGELDLIRSVLFVPPSMLASELMARMQSTRTQMALVIDEYGGTDGLVSLEDIVETVVGDIEDEHDEEPPLIEVSDGGALVADGKAELEDLAVVLGEDFEPGEYGESVDTIGGMIFNMARRVPNRGEVIQGMPGFEFHVLDADPRRVKRVRIVRVEEPPLMRAAAS